MELVDFLRARLDEDAELARAATQGEWVWSREFVTPPGYHHRTIGPLEPGDAAYIARQNPARVLADVEAKRKVLAGYASSLVAQKHASDAPTVGDLMDGSVNSLRYVVRLLACSFRDHPDFDPAWLDD